MHWNPVKDGPIFFAIAAESREGFDGSVLNHAFHKAERRVVRGASNRTHVVCWC